MSKWPSRIVDPMTSVMTSWNLASRNIQMTISVELWSTSCLILGAYCQQRANHIVYRLVLLPSTQISHTDQLTTDCANNGDKRHGVLYRQHLYRTPCKRLQRRWLWILIRPCSISNISSCQSNLSSTRRRRPTTKQSSPLASLGSSTRTDLRSLSLSLSHPVQQQTAAAVSVIKMLLYSTTLAEANELKTSKAQFKNYLTAFRMWSTGH